MDASSEPLDGSLNNENAKAADESILQTDEADAAVFPSFGATTRTESPSEHAIDPDTEIQALDESGSKPSDTSALGTLRSPARPILQRDASAPPPPPRQPPPPAPPSQGEDLNQPTDSLSLGQLKNIVANFPKLEPVAYAYTYNDTRSFPEELEEWFQYTQEDRDTFEQSRVIFDEKLGEYDAAQSNLRHSWLERTEEERLDFIRQITNGLENVSPLACLENLQCLAYIATGVWKETTSVVSDPSPEDQHDFEAPNEKYRRNVAQINCICSSASSICQSGALTELYNIIRRIWELETPYGSATQEAANQNGKDFESSYETIKTKQLNAALTVMYFVCESGRRQLQREKNELIRQSFMHLEPQVLDYLSQTIAKIRWSDEPEVPFTKVMLMLWKSTLLVMGDSMVLGNCKSHLFEVSSKDNESRLFASPLDYHVFRQEITSKYPAYNPPPPLIPLETNNNSILPPQTILESRNNSQMNVQGLDASNVSQPSIFNQPVHIATPAPSPPPSPAGPGGKGGKKQNYQTNQNFPFLYPPLDSNSNELGGKGKAEQQDKLVGKKWEGGDVPASIVEAGQLFASRMRMSRALRQLWKVREEFIRFERGWEQDLEQKKGKVPQVDEDFGRLDLDSASSVGEDGDIAYETFGEEGETNDTETLARLDVVEGYFQRTLPHLQSIIIVLLKILLSNVTVLGSIKSSMNGMPTSTDIDDSPEDKSLPTKNVNLSQQLTVPNNGQPEPEHEPQSLDELNSIRTREVTSKAISGFLLTILKWFRASHILKFEYVTQLLLDSNYIPLALKYFALQDIDRSVDLKHDRTEFDFFHVCHLLSGHPQSLPSSPQPRPTSSSSLDSAAPPPIARHRLSPPSSTSSSPPPSPGSPGSPPQRPEVDELGYPTTAIPPQPLTTYAPRFFFTYITTLRLLQKLTKGHAHRALLLVQYKSSTILRKALKIPQPSLRLYTLKLFKTQVPFCGRKWRQANMRVITAIYVFCRMGLRDDWISGGGQVEEMVEGAVGTESAWRGLTGWWLARKYRNALISKEDINPNSAASLEQLMLMARGGSGSGVQGANCGEDFFARELEKMGWGAGSEAVEDEVDEWGTWDGALELDGW